MTHPRAGITILMADDDADDRFMTQEAFKDARVLNQLLFVSDGEELMEFLENRGKYTDTAAHPLPGLILLDLNMPRKDGREALAEIKSSPRLRHIPVVVLTTTRAEEDVVRTYRSGANSFVTKPVTFKALVEVVQALGRYWLEIVDLPDHSQGGTQR